MSEAILSVAFLRVASAERVRLTRLTNRIARGSAVEMSSRYLEAISICCLGRLSAVVGTLSGWCRTCCGSCSSGWRRRRPRGLRAVVGEGRVTVKCWPRSCSWRRRAAHGSNRPRPPSGRPGQLLTAGSPSGRRHGCGPSCTPRSARAEAPVVAGPASSMPTRAATTLTCGDGYPSGELGTASPAESWDLAGVGASPLDHRTDHVLARRLPPSPPPLRAQSRALPRLHEHRLHPHLLPAARLLMWARSRFTARS